MSHSNDGLLEDIITMVQHEARKAQATTSMFIDLLPQIANEPDQLRLWSENLGRAFEPLERCLGSIALAAQNPKTNFKPNSLQAITAKANEQLQEPLYQWQGNDIELNSDSSLLTLFFIRLIDTVSTFSTTNERGFWIRAHNQDDKVELQLLSLNQDLKPLIKPGSEISLYLCNKILSLHNASMEKTSSQGHIKILITFKK